MNVFQPQAQEITFHDDFQSVVMAINGVADEVLNYRTQSKQGIEKSLESINENLIEINANLKTLLPAKKTTTRTKK